MRFLRALAACFVLVGLTSCGRDGPPDEMIIAAVQARHPQFKLSLSSVEVTPLPKELALLGRNGPTHRIVYEGVVSATEPLWEQLNSYREISKRGASPLIGGLIPADSHNVIVKVADAGTKAKVKGACATKKMIETWRVECDQFVDMAPKIQGQRLNTIDKQGKYIVEATSEIADVYFTSIAKYLLAIDKANAEFKAGRYSEALRLLEAPVAVVEKAETQLAGKPGIASTPALINLAWKALYANDYNKAFDASKRALTAAEAFSDADKEVKQLSAKTKMAHALICLGRVAEGKAIYSELRGNREWYANVLRDYRAMDSDAVTCPQMAGISRN